MSEVCTKKLASQHTLSWKAWPCEINFECNGKTETLVADITTPEGRAAVITRVGELGGDKTEIASRLEGVQHTKDDTGAFFVFQALGSLPSA